MMEKLSSYMQSSRTGSSLRGNGDEEHFLRRRLWWRTPQGFIAVKSSMSLRKMDTATERGWSGNWGGKDFPTASFYTCMMLFEPSSTHRDGPGVDKTWNSEEITSLETKHKGGEQFTWGPANAHTQRSQRAPPIAVGGVSAEWKEVCPGDTGMHKQIAGRRKCSRNWSFNLVFLVDRFLLPFLCPMSGTQSALGGEGTSQPPGQNVIVSPPAGRVGKQALPALRKRELVFWLLNVGVLGFNEPELIVKVKKTRLLYKDPRVCRSEPKGTLWE